MMMTMMITVMVVALMMMIEAQLVVTIISEEPPNFLLLPLLESPNSVKGSIRDTRVQKKYNFVKASKIKMSCNA